MAIARLVLFIPIFIFGSGGVLILKFLSLEKKSLILLASGTVEICSV